MATSRPCPQDPAKRNSTNSLNIATFNVSKIGGEEDKNEFSEKFEKELLAKKIDVALLQEVSLSWRLISKKVDLFEQYDRHFATSTRKKKADNYLMVLTRKDAPTLEVLRVQLCMEFHPNRVLLVMVEFNKEQYNIYNVHIMKENVGAKELFDTLTGYHKVQDNVIIVGDFNSVIRKEDRYWPTGKVSLCKPKKIFFERFDDIYPQGSRVIRTGPGRKARLDRIYVSSSLVNRLTDPETFAFDRTRSHMGVMCTIQKRPVPCGQCNSIDKNEPMERCIMCLKRTHEKCGQILEYLRIHENVNSGFRCKGCNQVDVHDHQFLNRAVQSTCPLCGQEVRGEEDSLKCTDFCERAFHRVCAGENEYKPNTWWCKRDDCKTIKALNMHLCNLDLGVQTEHVKKESTDKNDALQGESDSSPTSATASPNTGSLHSQTDGKIVMTPTNSREDMVQKEVRSERKTDKRFQEDKSANETKKNESQEPNSSGDESEQSRNENDSDTTSSPDQDEPSTSRKHS